MVTTFSLYATQSLLFPIETESFSKRTMGSPAIADTSTGSAASCSDVLGMLIGLYCSETVVDSEVVSAIVSSFIALFLSMDYNNINFWNNAKLIEIIRVSNIELPEVNQFERFSGLFNPQGLFGILTFAPSCLYLS